MSWLLMALFVPGVAVSGFPGQKVAERKTVAKDFDFPLERRELPNGLIVLLSADEFSNDVSVDLSFGCGALEQPPGKAGLAHLTEHALASGPTPETDYRQLLERRGATVFNGLTTVDRLSFVVVVPPEELELALWANADRLGTLPALLTADALERHRRIVMQEKLLRIEDAPYGASVRMAMRQLFPKTHPLHEGVMGTEATLKSVTVGDVQAFAHACLLPNNAVLTIAGRFRVDDAMAQVERTLGRLPRGGAPPEPVATGVLLEDRQLKVSEDVARMPRVTFAWSFSNPWPEHSEALELGSVLLPVYTDGLIGMRVESEYLEFAGGGLFVLAVTTPRAKDQGEAVGNAEVVLRNLTRSMMPADVLAFAFHVIDRITLSSLSATDGRVALIKRLVSGGREPVVRGFFDRHWKMSPVLLEQTSGKVLKGPHVSVEAKPTRPLPLKEPQ